MTRQVITIEPGGIMSGLQVKPGKGLDLTKFGPANVQRASEICWDDTDQKWFIQLTDRHWPELRHLMRLRSVRLVDYQRMTGNEAPLVKFSLPSDGSGILQFESYDQAVAIEIEFLDAARLKSLIV